MTTFDDERTRSRRALARVLGLRLMDRVQLANARQIELAASARRLDADAEYDWAYFLATAPDGMLVCQDASTRELRVDPSEVCDVRAGEPIAVLALTPQFRRQAVESIAVRQTQPSPQDWAPATLTGVVIEGRPGRREHTALVRFADATIDAQIGARWGGRVQELDEQQLAQIARCARVAVRERGCSPRSAERGMAGERRRVQRQAREFVGAALGGDRPRARRLAQVDLRAAHAAR